MSAMVQAPDDKACATLEAQLDAAQTKYGDDPAPADKCLETPCSVLSEESGHAPGGMAGGRLDDLRMADKMTCHTPCAAGMSLLAETLISQKTAGRVGEAPTVEVAQHNLLAAPAPAVAEAEAATRVSDAGSDAEAGEDYAASILGEEGASQATSEMEDSPEAEELGENERAEAGDALEAGEPEDEAGEAAAEVEAAVESAPHSLICKPTRALSSWAIWLAATHGGKISKSAGEEWRALSEEARAPFVEQAAQDKSRHAAQMAEYAAALLRGEADAGATGAAGGATGGAGPLEVHDHESALPIARVRRAMKAAKTGSKAISKEAAFLVSKAAEMVMGMLAEQAVEHVRREKRRALSLHDLGRVIYGTRSADLFAFLHDDLTRKLMLERVPARAAAKPRAPAKPRDPSQPRVQVQRRPAPAEGDVEAGEVEAGEVEVGDGPDAEGEGEAGAVAGAGRVASAGARKPAARGRPKKKEPVRGAVGKRRKPEAPVQTTTMTSFFSKQPGSWQPRADDYAAPVCGPAARPATKRRRQVRPGACAGEDAGPAQHDHGGLAKRLAEEEAEHEAAAAAAAGPAPSKRRRVVQSDDEEESGDEEEAARGVTRQATTDKARGKVATRRRAVVESEDEAEGEEVGEGEEIEEEEGEGEEIEEEEGEGEEIEEEEGEGEEIEEEEGEGEEALGEEEGSSEEEEEVLDEGEDEEAQGEEAGAE